MAKAGDTYEVVIQKAHLKWGTTRYTTSRTPIRGETYIKIPARYARMYDLKRGDLFTAHFSNGFHSMVVRAAGNGPFESGIQYAKQFHGVGRGACKALTPWYAFCKAKVGDTIRVVFLSPTDVLFTKL